MIRRLRTGLALTALCLLAGCGADLEGNWVGTWTGLGGRSGDLELQLKQSGSDVSGNLVATGTSCFGSAAVEGTTDGDEVTLTARAQNFTAELKGMAGEESFKGDFSIAAGSICGGQAGTFNLSLR